MKLIAQRPHIAGVVDSYSEATFEDIKQAHPKCGTCRFYGLNIPDGFAECTDDVSPYFIAWDGMIDPATDYCRYHEPKEENP